MTARLHARITREASLRTKRLAASCALMVGIAAGAFATTRFPRHWSLLPDPETQRWVAQLRFTFKDDGSVTFTPYPEYQHETFNLAIPLTPGNTREGVITLVHKHEELTHPWLTWPHQLETNTITAFELPAGVTADTLDGDIYALSLEDAMIAANVPDPMRASFLDAERRGGIAIHNGPGIAQAAAAIGGAGITLLGITFLVLPQARSCRRAQRAARQGNQESPPCPVCNYALVPASGACSECGWRWSEEEPTT